MNRKIKKALAASQEYEGRLIEETVRDKVQPCLSFDADDIADSLSPAKKAVRPSAPLYRVAAAVLVLAVLLPFVMQLNDYKTVKLTSKNVTLYCPADLPDSYRFVWLHENGNSFFKTRFTDGQNNVYLIQSENKLYDGELPSEIIDGKEVFIESSGSKTRIYFEANGCYFCVTGKTDISDLMKFVELEELSFDDANAASADEK